MRDIYDQRFCTQYGISGCLGDQNLRCTGPGFFVILLCAGSLDTKDSRTQKEKNSPYTEKKISALHVKLLVIQSIG